MQHILNRKRVKFSVSVHDSEGPMTQEPPNVAGLCTYVYMHVHTVSLWRQLISSERSLWLVFWRIVIIPCSCRPRGSGFVGNSCSCGMNTTCFQCLKNKESSDYCLMDNCQYTLVKALLTKCVNVCMIHYRCRNTYLT